MAFAFWMGHIATDEEKFQCLEELVVVRHWPYDLAIFGVLMPHGLAFSFWIHGKEYVMPEMPCEEINCERCRTGRGGYRFWWVDERWTPAACLLTEDYAAFRREIAKPWPTGLIRSLPDNRPDGETVP